MANTFATSSIVAKEALAVLENMLEFSKGANRAWESEFSSNMSRGYAPGQTINIKRPPRYTYRAGRTAVPQGTVETTVPLTLTQGGTDMNFTSAERTLSLVQLQPKIRAAMATVANEIDRQGLDLARTASYSAIASPAGLGTVPTTQAQALQFFTQLGQRLDEMGAPRDKDRSVVMNPALNGGMIQGLAGLFNSQGKISDQYGSGLVVDSLGFNVAMDQNVTVHTSGTQPAGPTANAVNGAGQSGSAITVNGAAITGTILRGTKVSFAGVFAVNPQSRQSTGVLAQFTVTADVAAAAVSIPIAPALTPSGAFQNVTASPANNAALTVFAGNTTYAANVAYHKNAFTLATVPLYAPPSGKGVIDVAQESYRGINLRVIEFYDGTNDNYIMRFDVLFGWAATYPELSVIAAV